jgi:dephospho-CoA kinase
MQKRKTIVVAITGGMGTGQSTVCKFLEKYGVKSINADNVAKKEIERNKNIQVELKKTFGSRIFYRNGKLNRKLLAKIAFSDEIKTIHLNKIVHPRMISAIINIIEEAKESQKYPIIVVDAALIYELSLEHVFDAVVVVTAGMKNRLERLKTRDNISEKEISERINKQLPVEEKVQWADYVIKNNGSIDDLKNQTHRLFQELKKLSRKKPINE